MLLAVNTSVFRSDVTRFLVRVRAAECVVMLQEEHTWHPLTHPARTRTSTAAHRNSSATSVTGESALHGGTASGFLNILSTIKALSV
jgi:hypothetical protein